MKTSNFANWKNQRFPGAISISRYPDRRSGFDGPEFPPLMPSSQLLKAYKEGEIDWGRYVKRYQIQLNGLKAGHVLAQLMALVKADESREVILLCYESAKTLDTKPCHRRIVAQWFEDELGLVVPEWSKES